MKERKKATIGLSLIPIIFMAGFLIFANLVNNVWESGWIDVHIPLLFSAVVAGVIAIFFLNYKWSELEEGIVDIIKASMGSILVLMVVGVVVGTWILSGIVPTMIFYGINILNPTIFLVVTLLICSIVSLAIGSSWTTVATVGIALMGIGVGLGIPKPVIAGAIISGAYFGDKMSPLSDTTNLAPAVSGAGLFEHIRHMIYTTAPSMIISIIFFGVYGLKYSDGAMDEESVSAITGALSNAFNINPILLLGPVLVIAMVALKVPPLPGLFCGALMGAIFAAIFQGASVLTIIDAMHNGVTMETGSKIVDELVSGGGLDGMMWTISLIICALIFGGIMEKTGMLRALAEGILRMAKRTGDLIFGTVLTSVVINVLSDQYLAIVIPGRIYKEEYENRGLHPKNLSRTLEDSGTLTSPLIPWNGCGAFMIGTLALAPWTYVPYCILNLMNPLVAIFYGYTGISIAKKEKQPEVLASVPGGQLPENV
jgi:Na+:H+ antiporter, NhaC family